MNSAFWNQVKEEIAGGYISERKHPQYDLYIYNYTTRTQFDRRWNVATTHCRGLITDSQKNIVSRPLPKFFNYGEVTTPTGTFTVHEKMDGVLGISYFVNGKMYIATRGSFTSDGAVCAQQLLPKYSHIKFDPTLTYMFEIIHPDTRIVVNYGGEQKLVFLAAIETATGREVEVDLDMPKPRLFTYTDLQDVVRYDESNFEGFVLRFNCGSRLKVKTSEYLRLHKIVSGCNERHIWENLMVGKPLPVDSVPDELFNWVKSVESRLLNEFNSIYGQAQSDLQQIIPSNNRKDLAREIIRTCRHPHVCFLLLDGKDPTNAIWKLIEPEPVTFSF